MKMSRGPLFFLLSFFLVLFFFFFFFAFYLFKPLKFVCLGSTKMEVSTGKKSTSHREKIRESDFAPLKKYSSYTTAITSYLTKSHQHEYLNDDKQEKKGCGLTGSQVTNSDSSYGSKFVG